MGGAQTLESLFDVVLKMKALNATVKLDIRTSCKMGLLLAMAVDQVLSSVDPGNLVKRMITDEDRDKLQELAAEILKKAEAEEVHELLKKMAKGV